MVQEMTQGEVRVTALGDHSLFDHFRSIVSFCDFCTSLCSPSAQSSCTHANPVVHHNSCLWLLSGLCNIEFCWLIQSIFSKLTLFLQLQQCTFASSYTSYSMEHPLYNHFLWCSDLESWVFQSGGLAGESMLPQHLSSTFPLLFKLLLC